MKEIKLSSGRKFKIKEMSVDDIDFCNDLAVLRYEDTQPVAVTGLAKARTAWLRKGLKDCTDKFIKGLSEEEKSELSFKIQEHQRLGEEKPSD